MVCGLVWWYVVLYDGMWFCTVVCGVLLSLVAFGCMVICRYLVVYGGFGGLWLYGAGMLMFGALW